MGCATHDGCERISGDGLSGLVLLVVLELSRTPVPGSSGHIDCAWVGPPVLLGEYSVGIPVYVLLFGVFLRPRVVADPCPSAILAGLVPRRLVRRVFCVHSG